MAHRNFVNVEKNSRKVTKQKSCRQAEEGDIKCALLAAYVAVDDVAAVIRSVVRVLLLMVVVMILLLMMMIVVMVSVGFVFDRNRSWTR